MPPTEWGFSGLSAFHVLTIVTTVTVNLNDCHPSTIIFCYFQVLLLYQMKIICVLRVWIVYLSCTYVRRESLEVVVAAQNTNNTFLSFSYFFANYL